MTNKANNTSNTLNHWHSFKLTIIFEGVLVGAFSGLVVVFYRFMLEEITHLSKHIISLHLNNFYSISLWFALLTFLAILVGSLLKRQPLIGGSGIPQIKGLFLNKLNMDWLKIISYKFIGGVLCIGAGLSLGREGPSIQLGASAGLGFRKLFKRMKIEEKYLVTSGASAGLAAAFNAPLSGTIFALEELHKSFSPLILLAAMSAAVTADFISKSFFGLYPVLNFENIIPLKLNNYSLLIVLGIIVGVLGVVFNFFIVKVLDAYDRQKYLPKRFQLIIPFIMAGLFSLILPQILGGGHELIVSLSENALPVTTLFILLFGKFLFTMICFGSGAPGGIFLPLLSIGAIIGAIYGTSVVNIFHLNPEYINNFIILAMAGYFTAIVKAPITGSILITEMTGSFNHLLSLTIVSIVAYVVSDLLHSEPIYETLLERLLMNNGDEDSKVTGKNKCILEFPVGIDTFLVGKKIKEISWPNKCLIVGLRRNQSEIIPKGNTEILEGDYLIALVDDDNATIVNETLLSMTESSLPSNIQSSLSD